jgi:Bacteriophage probable baseplate hub protein
MATPNQDQPLVPTFAIAINGTPLDGATAAHVDFVRVAQDLGLPSMFSFVISGTDDLDEEVPFVDDELFSIGNVVDVKLGYDDRVDTVMVGEIVALEPEFRQDGLPNLTVRGYDRLHRLQRGRKARTFVQQKDSDIASRIADESGLTAKVDDSSVIHDHIYQHHQTDFEFLLERARRINYELSVEDKTLNFRALRNGDGALFTLTSGADLLRFNARRSAAAQPSEVSVRGWSVKDKAGVVGQARAGDETSTMGGETSGPAFGEKTFGASPEPRGGWPTLSQAEADQAAKARLNAAALKFVTGEGVCLGRTDLRAGVVVDLQTGSKSFSGSYYVTGVEHQCSDRYGYLTYFTVRRSAS